jgi:hypothetical protein
MQCATTAGFTTGLSSRAGLTGTTLNVNGLIGNTTYFFRALAVGSASGLSSAGSASVAQLMLPSVATNV